MQKNPDGSLKMVQLCPDFHPGMSHQIFKDEKIVGVKNPEIDIYFNPLSCDVFPIESIDSRCVCLPNATPPPKVCFPPICLMNRQKETVAPCSQVDS